MAKKRFSLYDDMAFLVEGIVADGRSAYRPGRNLGVSENQDTIINTSTLNIIEDLDGDTDEVDTIEKVRHYLCFLCVFT